MQHRNVARTVPILVFTVDTVNVGQVAEEEESPGHVDGSLFGEGGDESGEDDVLDGGLGGDAAVPALVGGIGDDDVGPGHLETAKKDAGDDGDERSGDRVPDDVGGEKADDGAVEKLVDD